MLNSLLSFRNPLITEKIVFKHFIQYSHRLKSGTGSTLCLSRPMNTLHSI